MPAQTLVIDKKGFFTDERIIEMKLVTDFKKLINEKQKDNYSTNYQPATVTCTFPGNITITEEIAIRPRGEYRREECYIPSIMVNFKTPGAKTLQKLGRLKLVWSCSNTAYHEELILKEYLVYKIYNLLTEKSFRVRLVKMAYQDTRGKIKPGNSFAFFIEDVDDMARRNNCREVEPPHPHTESTDRAQTTLVALFEYMIGNTDWAVPIYRNIKLIRSRTDSLALPFIVPYDFDYCGLVNARYAIPAPELGILSVRQRKYRGFPRSMEELRASLEVFRRQRPNMDTLIMNTTWLSPANRKAMKAYIDDFFEHINNDKFIRDIFIREARKE